MLDYKLVDVKLVGQVVEAIKSGNVSVIGGRFVITTGADLSALPEYIRLFIVGGDIVVRPLEAGAIREALEEQHEQR